MGLFQCIREKKPLIHCITNYVTVNDCANILLASGASPVMADDTEEVEEITALADALVINIGTLNARTIEAMLLAGKRANELSHPVILDPVGAGASTLRTKTARRLLEAVHFDVIRGNPSELKALVGERASTRGVDAAPTDAVRADNVRAALAFVRGIARETHSIIAMTGAVDIVVSADGTRGASIYNGHPMMAAVTGTGCQLSSLLGAALAAGREDAFTTSVGTVAAMGIAGETAHRLLTPTDGNAAYRSRIIDAVYNMTDAELEEESRYEICRL
ncbi:hydroxyethylthiazole kinase [Selenomonas sp. TAMA-11512]|uniref:hydroxyethylthiazole kinase n=1 Tax=Selenomonas sp. TAMA-11512 TaxID=3095337 RepID=UPI00308EC931|nr:hydroxyethylthiazole kinase [Selenomonas sp. TAMA-11512]